MKSKLVVFSLCGIIATIAMADSESENLLDKATKRAAQETYALRYKLKKGEVVTYETEQLATVDTKIEGNNQKTKLRTTSVRSLDIEESNQDGTIVFSHTIHEVDMWSEVDDRKPVRYNSKTDSEPPGEFENVAQTIGKPLSKITMDSKGKIIKRDDAVKQANLGMGGLSIPLPDQPISVGHKWSQPMQVRVRLESKRIKEIKTRELYELKKVLSGVATISVKTEILTPVKDPKIKVQLLQRISAGEIKFDIDAGRLISKRLDWDETVLGFNGPKSNMKYLARFTEKLVDKSTKKTAKRKTTSKK